MKLRKIIVILLAVALLFSVAACKKTEDTKVSAEPTKEKATEAAEQEQETTEAESMYPEYLNMDSELPIIKNGENITLSIAVKQDDATGGDAEDIWFWAWAQKNMNIDFDVQQILGSALGEKKNLMFASGELPDVMLGLGMTTNELVTYGQNEGQLLKLNDYLTQENAPNVLKWFEKLPTAKGVSACPDGSIYTLPRIGVEKDNAGNGRAFINQTWLEAVDMETPETLDDFIAMLRAFKEQDPSGVGSENVIPLGGGANPPDGLYGAIDPRYYVLNAMGFLTVDSNGTEAALRNGEVVMPANDPLYKEYLSIMNTLYTEGLISQDFFTIDDTQVRAQAAEGLVGVIAEPAYLSMPETYKEWWAVKPLTSEWNDTPQWLNTNRYAIGGFSISADTEYPEAAVRFGDFFFSDLGSQYMYGGPLADTDDTLGMVGGYKIDDNDNFIAVDVENGKYDSTYAYLMGAIAPTFPAVGNFSSSSFEHYEEAYRFTHELAGKGLVKRVYSEDNPDNHYRMGVMANLLPYVVDGYPSILYFTQEESTKISDLQTVIRDYVATETAKFITGARSLDEFDAYLAELEKLGIEEYTKYYVDAYADYMAAQG